MPDMDLTPKPCGWNGQIRLERRQQQRRDRTEDETLSSHDAFDAGERAAFKHLEQRRHIRRSRDVKRAIASLAG